MIHQASIVAFLGFSFDALNLEKLDIPRFLTAKGKDAYATVHGMPRNKVEIARNRCQIVHMFQHDCLGLLLEEPVFRAT